VERVYTVESRFNEPGKKIHPHSVNVTLDGVLLLAHNPTNLYYRLQRGQFMAREHWTPSLDNTMSMFSVTVFMTRKCNNYSNHDWEEGDLVAELLMPEGVDL
jgi:ABC-type sulfate transport system substrate-binding protein